MTRVGWGGSVTLESKDIGAMGDEMRWDGGVRRRNGGETSLTVGGGGDAAAGGGDGFRYGPGPGDTGANGGNSTGGKLVAPSDSMFAHSAAVQLPNVSDSGSAILEEPEAEAFATAVRH
jgi:hypothetical protein